MSFLIIISYTKTNTMRKSIHKKISVFLKIDAESINTYFNPHDPAQLEKRQLGPDFQEYLNNSVECANRHTIIDYKVFSSDNGSMSFIVEPLMKTIRRHFQLKKIAKQLEFQKFKRKNFKLLLINIVIVMLAQGAFPILVGQDHRIHSAFSNAIDVFSWVILWKPIERLIFYWNPFKKEILMFNKLQNAKVTLVENEEELINYHMGLYDAA